ncbi:hypothetical protein DET49_101158 [Salegentibacter sp. 24]|uniref:hypothetical protein n=1 Tax=Salegentibacter sp. 24 TaxID=2183986 RepID=UPI0010600895|nr:hypothetical protein [Salegentibacter sp. 24]TDN95560.1 hypothetical protein DET49_101158 [Salegentibacter sp. 24]
MKKLGITLIAVAGMFLFSQNAKAQVEDPEEMESMEAVEEIQEEIDEFVEVDVVALPQAVKDAVMTDMNGVMPEEAWVKEEDGKSIYKLVVNVDGEKEKVYIDSEGNWIEKEDK